MKRRNFQAKFMKQSSKKFNVSTNKRRSKEKEKNVAEKELDSHSDRRNISHSED